MRPQESFVSQPIRSLQTMLRVIAENDASIPSLIPDGFYGQNTVRSVSAFQRRYGLSPTGVVDQATWDAIVPIYEAALVDTAEAEPLFIILEPGQVIRRGEKNANLYIVQAILTVLSETFDGLTAPTMTGVLDTATSESLSNFQRLHALPDTGELDKQTWRRLALQYPQAANLQSRL